MENNNDSGVDPWDVLAKYGITKENVSAAWAGIEKVLEQLWALKVQAEERAAFDRYFAAYISTQNWGMLTDPAIVADWACKALKERLKLFPLEKETVAKAPEPEKVAEPTAEKPS